MDLRGISSPAEAMKRYRSLPPEERKAFLAAMDEEAGAALTQQLGEEFAPMIQRAVNATPDMVGGNGSTNPMDTTGEQPNVAPEEQEQYDRFVANGMKLVFAQGARDQIVNRIKASNPIEGLAAATVQIVRRLNESAGQKGMQVSPDVLMHGGLEIMGNIAELAEAANAHSYSEEEIEKAMYMALDQYGTQELQAGRIDKEAVANDLQEMMAADKEGRLEEALPGIEEKGRGK